MELNKIYYILDKTRIIKYINNDNLSNDTIVRFTMQFFNHKQIILFAQWNAKNAIANVKTPDQRILDCITEVDRYLVGNSMKDRLKAAADAAADAAAAAYAAYAAYHKEVKSKLIEMIKKYL